MYTTIAILALFIRSIYAVPTWPSSIDEIEDLMVLQTGYRSLGFASAVTPCSNSVTKGFRTAAGFLRTAFHDVAAFDASAGTGGLDASIGFECKSPFSDHNSGPDFTGAMAYYSSFFNSKASMADLIALGAYASVRSCGGPIIAMKAGRIDATAAGQNNLPDAGDSKEVLIARFAKMGFSQQEMIQLVACGHTLGGVHPGVNPSFNPQDPNAAAQAAQAGVLTFDSSDAQFDNRVAVEYVSGTTQNPLVVGPRANLNSDLRVFSSDNNVTITSMTNPNVYQGTCQVVLQKMLERVPSNVQLSDVIQPYDVKPGQLNFNVLSDGSLAFSGEIRIRTTNVGVSGVQILYSDDTGNACDGCSIDTTFAGNANGFDDSFSFYGFSAKVDSISSFKVAVTTSDGQLRVYDNNGNGFKVNDRAFVQVSSSSLSGSQLKVVVAVREQPAQSVAVRAQAVQPQIILSTTSAFEFNSLPTVSKISGNVIQICGGSRWSFYYATFTVSAHDLGTAKIDVLVGGIIVDGFRDINFPSSGTTPTCFNAVSTTLSTSTISSTSSTTRSLSTTSTASTTSTSSVSSTSTLSSTSSTTSTSSSTSSSSTTSTSGTSSISSASSTSSTSTTSGSSSTTSSTSSSTTTTQSGSQSVSTSASSSGASFDVIVSADLATTSSSTSSSVTTTGSLTSTVSQSPLSSQSLSSTFIDPDGSVKSYSSTSKSSTTSVNVPAWSVWQPAPSPASGTKPLSGSGKASNSNAGIYATGAPGAAIQNQNSAQAALASAYQSLANIPAPSGGTDGGNKNLDGLNLGIQVSDVKPQPIITGTTAVYTNTVVYVTTLANPQESANLYSAQSSGWSGWSGADSNSAKQVHSQGTSGVQTAQGAGSSSAVWDSWGSQGVSATPTKTGPVAIFTGAADSLRSGNIALGAAVVLGVVAIMV